MAAVDIKGTMKDFCSVACLEYFKSNTAPTQSPQSVCSICKKHCSVSDSTCQPSQHFHIIFTLKAPLLYYLRKDTCEGTLNEVVHKVCSDCSLEDFCSDNTKICEHCSLTCQEKSLVLLLEDDSKMVCSLACLEALKEVQKHHNDLHLEVQESKNLEFVDTLQLTLYVFRISHSAFVPCIAVYFFTFYAKCVLYWAAETQSVLDP